MKVVTLNHEKFSNVCITLYEKVLEDFNPDVLVSIASGGDYVAKEIHQRFGIKWFSVEKQRKSTTHKNSRIGRVFFKLMLKLPVPLLDILRNIEHRFATIKVKRVTLEKIIPLDVSTISEEIKGKKVLIIDDALDSGITMASVRKGVAMEVGSEGDVRTAVIVQTNYNAIICADYKLFDSCLVRFPWSKDMRQ